jgi:CheY-like chemotaxis protein
MVLVREVCAREVRILLVEDEEPIRDLVTTALRFTEFTVETATTRPDGLDLAQNDPWHVLMLDVNRRGLDGSSLWRKLREAGDEVGIWRKKRPGPGDPRRCGAGLLPPGRR